ncbi:MAG: LytTR family DNA-binding domain-containing protein [Ferruginibacter sp.]
MLNGADVLYIRAKASYSVFVLTNRQEVLSSLPIAMYGRLFHNECFFRVHRSFLVNLEHVVEIVRSGDVILTGGVEVPITKEHIKALVIALAALNEK